MDAAGKKREIWVDALGRTIEVDEPNSSNSLTGDTGYQHDANGNLTAVASPGGQTRSYSYDDLGRPTSVTTPESGITSYTYDTGGNLATKKDARNTTATYAYDALHRVTSIAYSDGTSTVHYYYDQTSYNGLTISDGKGRRTGMSDGSGATAWSYDAAGRIATERRTIAGITKNTGYSYKLDGSLASLTYPDGRVVNYAYSNAERPTQAIDSAGINYATSGHYAAQGALTSAIHGYVSGGFGGITETWGYNSDLEPTSIVASSSAGTALNLSYSHLNTGSVSGITNRLAQGRDTKT